MSERRTHNPFVRGSSPCGPTIQINALQNFHILIAHFFGIHFSTTTKPKSAHQLPL